MMSELARTITQRLMLDRQVDFWLEELRPRWVLARGQARVVRVIPETHDVKTFVLARSGWSHDDAPRAGQYVPIEVEIDGRQLRRCYSLSSAPGSRERAITVKRVPGGVVSTFLHDHVREGDLLRVGAPVGEFVLPESPPPELLFVTGGSGITPAMSMLRDLVARDLVCDVVFVVCARTPSDGIFAAELCELALRHAGLRLVLRHDDQEGRLDPASLRALVPDLASRLTYLCGPAPMMAALAPIWESPELASRLRREHFASPVRASRSLGEVAQASVQLTRSGRTVRTEGGEPLLVQLERAGERPPHGCRIGICNTCRCRKVSGVTEDLRTGALSSAPDEDIRLCVSVARSDVTLAL